VSAIGGGKNMVECGKWERGWGEQRDYKEKQKSGVKSIAYRSVIYCMIASIPLKQIQWWV